jgi:hypothetical protein
MKQVWKFPLRMAGAHTLKMPEGSEILCLREQDDVPCLWALVDPSAPQERRHFLTYGTGHDMTTAGRYVGTTIHLGGTLVLHTFEVSS